MKQLLSDILSFIGTMIMGILFTCCIVFMILFMFLPKKWRHAITAKLSRLHAK